MKELRCFVVVAICIISTSAVCQDSAEGYLQVGADIRLYYRMVGDGPETWIIPSAAWLYPGLVPLASEGRTLVFFDTRARGASDPVERDEDLAFHYDVADLEALRAALEIDEAYVVGWSYLGAVAGRYAIEHPDRVEGPRSREPVGAARVDP